MINRPVILLIGACLASGGAVLLAALPARASLTIDHESGADGCTEASSYFPEDESPEATRARRRCRLEIFDRQLEKNRLRDEIQSESDRDKLIQGWIEKQDIPVRVFRRNSIDGYVGSGITTYGLAVGGLLLPWLEAELSLGRRDVSQSITSGYFQDSRSCWGGRFKWLMRSHGNLTPFASAGAASCSANVALTPYNVSPPVGIGAGTGTSTGTTGGNGTAVAHVATATAGLAWMEKSGFRVSLEYVFAYAFYSQATLSDAARTEDPNLLAAWNDRLASERSGIRLQVGYAF